MIFRRLKLLLSDKYPFLTNYFTETINTTNHPLPQSILFYGNDFDAQYTLSKEIARLLNCKNDKSDNCECLNCKWIREDSHPAVMLISKNDNKPESDQSKNVISIEQSTMIKEMLVNSSEFHRVFIFCDRDENNNITGLNQQSFQAVTANSLLKIIEEPHSGVTFIFLTRYLEDLLPTIISRSQCFFVPAIRKAEYNYDLISGIFDNYLDFERKNAFDISLKLQELTKNNSSEDILNAIQNYILTLLKLNPKQTELIKHIEIVEQCKKQAKLGIKPHNFFDDLCLKLITK